MRLCKVMLSIFIVGLIVILSSFEIHAQNKNEIAGYVRDASNGETLIGATVRVIGSKKAVQTNTYGYFSIDLPDQTDSIAVSYIGYVTSFLGINTRANKKLTIDLKPVPISSKEVVITGEKSNKQITSTTMSIAEISGEKLKSLPVILGEQDVLKAITLLPGIKSGGEAGTGFYVRGGGPDQNLILMDEAVVYNPSHLFGFLSVFNSDAVKNIEIIKGGMPANYGGRLSSILNVTMREGNNKKMQSSGGIGLISSRLTVEGPIKKGISSFLVSGRRTYIDVLAKPFVPAGLQGNSYYFYDFNVKTNWVLNDKNRLFFSGYFGRDVLNFQSPRNKDVFFNFGWGNSTATLRWNHLFNKQLFLNTSFIYNRYDLFNNFTFGNNGFNVKSGVEDINLKMDFNWFGLSNHSIKYGYNYTFHKFQPGILSGSIGNTDLNQAVNSQYAHEFAAYLADEWKINQRIALNIGLRAVAFNLVGPFEQKEYDTDTGLPTGLSKTYKNSESIAFYPVLEPRASVTYLINEASSVKASFTQTYQFLHLATTSGAQFPVDLWVPSSQKVKPQLAYQYAIGYYRNFLNDAIETSVETYYKPMFNQIEFKPGAQLFFNQNLENEMVFGKGLSYGIEFLVRKNSGRLNGWVGYTWSRSTRQFDQLNQGQVYFYRYDRTHDMSLTLSYQINKKWTTNFVFVFGTGNAVTLPSGRYAYRFGFNQTENKPEFVFVDVYDKINSYRLPAYHRADISFTYLGKKTEKWESSWNFSIYNLYNRANPYFIYFYPDIELGQVKAYLVYLFPILPSVQWNFKF
jgi:hypothetical protein